jgi:hypothetical protein
MTKVVPGKFSGIVGQDPSDSKSNQLHVDIIFRFCFHSFEVYFSTDSSKMIGNPPEVLNFNQLFLKLNRFICIKALVLPEPWTNDRGELAVSYK